MKNELLISKTTEDFIKTFEKKYQNDLLEKQKKERKWALVCQGGGFKGAWEAGFLTAIRELSDFDFLTHIGTSIGGINAALMIASRQDPNVFEQVWKKITWWKILCLFRSHKRLEKLFLPKDITTKISNIIEQDSVFLEIITSQYNNDDPNVPKEYPFIFKAKKYKINNRSFDEHDKIKDSLLATASIPKIFPKKIIEEMEYADGGILKNNPIDYSVDLGIKNILVLLPDINISKNFSMIDKTTSKIPGIAICNYIDVQVIKTIQNIKDSIIKGKHKSFGLNIFICIPSKKLKTDGIKGYLFATQKNINSDFDLGIEDGKIFIADLKKSNTKKYDLKNITLKKPIKTYYDNRINYMNLYFI